MKANIGGASMEWKANLPTSSQIARQQNDEKIRLQEEGFAEDREKQRIKNNSMRQAFNSKGEPILNFWNKYDENNQDNKPKSKSDIFMENYLAQPTARNLYYNTKGQSSNAQKRLNKFLK